MKESRLYWTIKKDIINQILKTKKDPWHPNQDDIFKSLAYLGKNIIT
jgi:hypothetical protein